MTTKITPAEALSEFRKFSRAFQALEHAENLVNMLTEKDQILSDLTKEVKHQEEKVNLLENKKKEIVISIETLKNQEKLTEERLKKEEQDSKVRSSVLISSAMQKAEKIIQEALDKKQDIIVEINSLEEKRNLAESKFKLITQELEQMTAKFEREKAKILQAFGV